MSFSYLQPSDLLKLAQELTPVLLEVNKKRNIIPTYEVLIYDVLLNPLGARYFYAMCNDFQLRSGSPLMNVMEILKFFRIHMLKLSYYKYVLLQLDPNILEAKYHKEYFGKIEAEAVPEGFKLQ